MTSQAWHFPLRTTATALCRQPKLHPCCEILQHSWKSCRCDWELCFNTPGASKGPVGASEALLLKFHMLSPHGGGREVYWDHTRYSSSVSSVTEKPHDSELLSHIWMHWLLYHIIQNIQPILASLAWKGHFILKYSTHVEHVCMIRTI